MKRSRVLHMDRRGFTLIELLIVLAILVGIMAIAVPRLMKARRRGQEDTARAQIGAFNGALKHYELDTSRMPMTEQGLAALVQAPADSGDAGGFVSTGWNGPYLDKIPKDPWGMDYQYEYPPTRGGGDQPDIWSLGVDNTDGTEDDVCSWTTTGTGAVDEDGNPIEDPMDAGMDPLNDGPPMPPMDRPTPPGGMPGRPPLPSANRPPAMPGPPAMPARPAAPPATRPPTTR
jgi:general secretion pathway protein G